MKPCSPRYAFETSSSKLVVVANCDYTGFVRLGGASKGGYDRVVNLEMVLVGHRRKVERAVGVPGAVSGEVEREFGGRRGLGSAMFVFSPSPPLTDL